MGTFIQSQADNTPSAIWPPDMFLSPSGDLGIGLV